MPVQLVGTRRTGKSLVARRPSLAATTARQRTHIAAEAAPASAHSKIFAQLSSFFVGRFKTKENFLSLVPATEYARDEGMQAANDIALHQTTP